MHDPIRVMIVDDERLALEDLETIVDWSAFGYEIVATAFNGAQAFAKFQQFRPQIVITDIKMPIMDGIALIQKIREVDQQVLLLLLTAYADFSYARTAIQLGITDYIIKSEITAQSMEKLLTRLRASIEKQRKNRSILTDTMLETFFSQPDTEAPGEAEEMLRRQYAFLVLERDAPLMLDGSQPPLRGRLTRAALKQLLSEQPYPDLSFASTCSLNQQRTLLALRTPDNSAFHAYELMYRSALLLHDALAESDGGDWAVYLAMRPMSFYDLRRLLQNNADIFTRKYFKPRGALLVLERLPAGGAAAPRFDKAEFENALEQADGAAAAAFLQRLYDGLAASGDAEALLTASRELYYILQRSAELLPEQARGPVLSPESEAVHWHTASDLCKWLTERTQELLSARTTDRRAAYSRTVSDAIAHVYAHYAEPELSLNDIADELHLSVGHLCLLFKQETGVTLKNYITDVRMEAAKRMLRSGHAKIYEISTAVGYQTSQYFSQVFYKKVGMFPAEYRKNGGDAK